MPRPLLADATIAKRLADHPGWSHEEGALRRKLVFKDFREAMAFLVLIAFDAEEQDHHPEATIAYKRVAMALNTHDSGGITEADFKLLASIEAVLKKFAA